MATRRSFIRGLGLGLGSALLVPAAVRSEPRFSLVDMRGMVDATAGGLAADTSDDQSRAFAGLLAEAAPGRSPVFLPPGTYAVSNIVLPDGTRLVGVPGATRIVYTGGGFLFRAENAGRITLSGLSIDGQNRWLGNDARALVETSGVETLSIDDCEISGSAKSLVATERTGGRITGNRLTGAAEIGLYAVESNALSIEGNHVADCGNGGILVHRWSVAEDGSIVTGNRVERIAAKAGGTGQNGNGINIFRAGDVTVSNNRVYDCAFSAIRSNSGANVMISGNRCHRSGETAIYSEFAFEGAAVIGNIVDGAANGISIANFNEGGRLATISGNIVRNLSETGPYTPEVGGFGWGIGAEADTAITGNTIDNAPKWGMLLGWGPYLRAITATGNVIRKAGTGIAVSVVEGAGATLIADNVFQDTPGGAVVGYRWGEAATGDLAAAGRSGFSHLTVERNVAA